MSDQTLNVPSLFLVVLVTSLAIRYFFFSPQSSPTASHPPRIDPAHVEQIATMFPQVDRRSIQWDLQRNGGSVTATTERILSRGVLDPVCLPSWRSENRKNRIYRIFLKICLIMLMQMHL